MGDWSRLFSQIIPSLFPAFQSPLSQRKYNFQLNEVLSIVGHKICTPNMAFPTSCAAMSQVRKMYSLLPCTVVTRTKCRILAVLRRGKPCSDILRHCCMTHSIVNGAFDSISPLLFIRMFLICQKSKASIYSLYEARGPGGSALLIEVLTDNNSRTLQQLKSILNKNG